MEFKRTPDERFDNLVDYPFQPHYLQVDDTEGGELRIHYLDEGPPDGDVVLLLHGQPAWSYLYRHMIPPLVEAGFRVIAPDLVGFGRSDKPTRIEDYTYARHVAWMSDWLTRLDLNGVPYFSRTGAALSACGWWRPSRSTLPGWYWLMEGCRRGQFPRTFQRP
jgi:haloalkane dehalogenase